MAARAHPVSRFPLRLNSFTCALRSIHCTKNGLCLSTRSPRSLIKYGGSVIWNEVAAQAMAHKELRGLRSSVGVPAIFYACELTIPGRDDKFSCKGYVVMECVHVKTAGESVEGIEESDGKNAIYSRIAFALSELHRIPVPQGVPPTAINGGRIGHSLFDLEKAPRHYGTVRELEDQRNLFLSVWKRPHRIQALSQESMVFCYSDVWLDNKVTVIDFADVSILPSSFSKFALSARQTKIGREISDLVIIPTTHGVDNTLALRVASGLMVKV
ncbi:Fc.00g023090.m01.CDS01 [Cosmosporella sp. VM-42]